MGPRDEPLAAPHPKNSYKLYIRKYKIYTGIIFLDIWGCQTLETLVLDCVVAKTEGLCCNFHRTCNLPGPDSPELLREPARICGRRPL